MLPLDFIAVMTVFTAVFTDSLQHLLHAVGSAGCLQFPLLTL